jgi:hypothetical protein
MDIIIKRISEDKDSTLGALYLDDCKEAFAFTLEDEFRAEKVKGETRIPEGIYKLVINKAVTPLTEKYRSKYAWFKYHIILQDVKNFSNVYIHVGNYETHTDGCILLGTSATLRNDKSEFISNSASKFEEFYKIVYPLLERGELVRLNIE